MRLINTTTLELIYYVDENVPEYGILSHTWDREEVTFEDYKAGSKEKKAGYHKIQRSCELAVQDGLSLIWIDTCCIDKSSSAELSEAINSMHRYYRNAKFCYTYLADLPDKLPVDKDTFAACRWFCRGWTLQELIAPRKLVFLSTNWRRIGTKSTLASEISYITGIDKDVLLHRTNLWQVSIATRMSWASNRQTSREEDIAYCLLGIFGINMPLLYGEGNKAFLRLQEEIMKDSTDQSLFAWSPRIPVVAETWGETESSIHHKQETYPHRGILANHPSEFANASNIVPYEASMEPFAMTNSGLRITIPIISDGSSDPVPIAVLSCYNRENFSESIGIFIEPTGRAEAGVYFRCNIQPITVSDSGRRKARTKSIYILKEIQNARKSELKHAWVRSLPPERYGFKIDQYVKPLLTPYDSWNATARTISLSSEGVANKQFGGVVLDHKAHPKLLISFGYIRSRKPACVYVDISLLPQPRRDILKLLEDIWIQRVLTPDEQPPRKPLTAFIRRVWREWSLFFEYLWRDWNKMQPRRLSQTAVLNITSNRTVSATATVQGLMDEEILVLDIDAYDSLFRQFLHTLGLDHKVLVVSLGIIALALSISVVFSSGMKGVKPYIGIQN